MVRDRLLLELLVVDLLVDVVVDLLDADVAKAHRPERRPQVLADDALVVLLAPLPGRALLEPVVRKIVERLVRRRRVANPFPDLRDLDCLRDNSVCARL